MRRKIILGVVSLPLLLIVGGLIYINVADLSGYREMVEETLTEQLGRELVIAGEFRPEISFSPGLVATEIRLRNAEWGAEPEMVQIDRFEAVVGLWSLVSGPLMVHELKIDGARIVLEDPGEGRVPNWEFETSTDEPPSDEPAGEILFGKIEIGDVVLEYRDPGLEETLVLRVATLDAHSVEDGRVDLRLAGSLNDIPLDLSGLIGPTHHLIDMTDVRNDLHLRLGDSELSLEGLIADLSTLEGPDLRLELRGPDIEQATGALGLPYLGSGPFEAVGSLTPSERGVEIDLDASLGELSADVKGFVSGLLDPAALDAAVAVACPDLGALASLFKVQGVPAEKFEVSGRVLRDDERFTFEELVVTLGPVAVSADGVLGQWPSMVDTDFSFSASGPALSIFSALAGVELPAEPFRIDARLLRLADGISVESFAAELGENRLDIEGKVGEPPELYGTELVLRGGGPELSSFSALAGTELPAGPWELSGPVRVTETGYELEDLVARAAEAEVRVNGHVGPPPELAGTDLRVRVAGADLSKLSATAGVDLPAEPYTVEGRVRPEGEGLALEGFMATLGGIVVEAAGHLGLPPDLHGSDVRVSVRGSHLSRVGVMAGLEQELPAESYDLRGNVRVDRNGYVLDGLAATLADITLGIDGRVGPAPDLTGTDLQVRVDGSDLSTLGALAGVSDLPAETYALTGRVRGVDGLYELEGIAARVGDIEIEAEGRVGSPPELRGTKIGFRIGGSDLSKLAAYGDIPALPAEPFTVSGTIGVEEDLYRLESVVAALVGNRVTVDGVAGPLPELTSTDVKFDVSVPDVDALGRMLTEVDLVELPRLPAKPLSATGRLAIGESGYDLRGLEARYGRNTFRVDGKVGHPPELHGTDLTVLAEGPDGSVVGALAGVALPAEPFRVHGRVGRDEEWARFDDLVIDLGEYHVEVEGSVGEPPEMIGTNFEVAARGPSLELISAIADLPPLPAEPFDVAGHFDGNPERFKMDRFSARLGESDLSGDFRVDLRDKPELTGEFVSEKFDLTMFMDLTGEASAADEPDRPETSGSKLLIPDEPLELDVLDSVNAVVRWTAGELVAPEARYSDFEVVVHLDDGGLSVDPLRGSGEWGGSVRGSFALVPVPDGYRTELHLTGNDLRLALPGSEIQPTERPATNFELHLQGHGRSLHEIASSADGGVGVARGAGITDNAALDLLGADILSELLHTLNPFSKTQEHTQMECTVLFVEIEEGVASFDPMALRTDKMTLLGKGAIDFSTEKIRLDWKTKPRKGLGVGAGSLVNPFVELGGTLGHPKISLDPMEAAKTTGMAVATVGLSVLGEGLWNRFSAGKKTCAKVLADAKERLALHRVEAEGE